MDNIFYYQKIYDYMSKNSEASRHELVLLLKELHCANPEHILTILPTSPNQTIRESNQVFRPPFVLETIENESLYRKRFVNPLGN